MGHTVSRGPRFIGLGYTVIIFGGRAFAFFRPPPVFLVPFTAIGMLL